MNILVDLVHPAHVHVFRNAIKLWQDNGHKVLVTSRKKDCTLELLDSYGIEHHCLTSIKSGIVNLFLELITRDLKVLIKALRFKPDVLTGVAGICPSHIGFLLRKPSVVFYDTEFATLSNSITYPIATTVSTPESYREEIRDNHNKYPGYHELAYLHPNYFTPNIDEVKELGLGERPYFLLRFVSWQASHDLKEVGIPLKVKRKIIEKLSKHGDVIISSESPLPEEFKKYEFNADYSKIHQVIANANMVIGESATMASEAAVLGVPAVFIAKTDRGYTEDQENRYGLVKYFSNTDSEKSLEYIDSILSTEDYLKDFQEKREEMLSETIDVTKYIYETVLAYAKNGRKIIPDLELLKCVE